MAWCNISIALVCLIILAIVHSSQAQNSPQDYLAPHNAARAVLGIEPLTWDEKVATYARDYAQKRIPDCNFVRSKGGPYGENIAVGNGNFTAKSAVGLWVDEKLNYDPKSSNCVVGKLCRQYRQVVWRKSHRLGCARVQCDNNWIFINCNYDPLGNIIGERPY